MLQNCQPKTILKNELKFMQNYLSEILKKNKKKISFSKLYLMKILILMRILIKRRHNKN